MSGLQCPGAQQFARDHNSGDFGGKASGVNCPRSSHAVAVVKDRSTAGVMGREVFH